MSIILVLLKEFGEMDIDELAKMLGSDTDLIDLKVTLEVLRKSGKVNVRMDQYNEAVYSFAV